MPARTRAFTDALTAAFGVPKRALQGAAHSIVTQRSFIPAHRCSYTLAIGTVTPAVRYGLSSRVIGKV